MDTTSVKDPEDPFRKLAEIVWGEFHAGEINQTTRIERLQDLKKRFDLKIGSEKTISILRGLARFTIDKEKPVSRTDNATAILAVFVVWILHKRFTLFQP